MNKNFTFFGFITLLLIGSTVRLQAQATPFWSEDFANGIPSSWTNTDASNQGAIWTWCSDPTAGSGEAGCPSIFNDGINGQAPFAAETAANGFATVDSDEYGNLGGDHISRLTTSAIDASGASEVWLTFQTHIGVYTIPAATGALLRVSTDGVNWTPFTVFPDMETTSAGNGDRWSPNPAYIFLDISSVAANQATVYLQWEWTGNYEYHWSLDDIAVYDQNPSPRNDVAIESYFYPVSSYGTPESQIATDTFGFAANLSNRGQNAATNIVVKAWVTDGNNVLYADSLTIPSLAAGVTDSLFALPGLYAPELSEGQYFIHYSVRSDSIDEIPTDNAAMNDFVVTTTVFSKENAPEQGYRPGTAGDWAVGNYYRMGGGTFEQYLATHAEFAIAVPDNLPIENVESTIYFFKVRDDVAEDWTGFDDSELTSPSFDWLGLGSFISSATVTEYSLQQVEITDLNAGTAGVLLEPNGRYVLAASYEGPSNEVYHAFNDNQSVSFVNTLIFRGTWFLGGFGDNVNAVLRLHIALATSTDDKPLPATTLNVVPNPIQGGQVRLQVDFPAPTDATITLADISGRVIYFEDRQGLTNELLTYQQPNLKAGTYIARIATAEGTLTKKFVVVE